MSRNRLSKKELVDVVWDELGLESTESDYKAALKRIESLFDAAEPDTPEGHELEKLVTWVEKYEDAVERKITRQRENFPEVNVNLDEL